MRPDLSRGILGVQILHSAGESSPGNLPSGTYGVLLSAEVDTLCQLEQKLLNNKIPHTAIRETMGVYAGQLMAIGVVPGRRSKLRRYFSSVPLLR